ncbi:lysophospholipid acyltransferase family protein [Neisseria sp. Ec49-e6-T10]|uniref:lysophospholipid acyltransferase family protein n=1 Tax=Neisseria sp. Ec49-e6-T10 TaxID=3140744 RepID=UPI003EBA8548
MLIIRNILYWIGMISLTFCMVIPFIIGLILPRRVRHHFGVFWAKGNIRLLEWTVGLKYQVIGQENMPTEPSIICCKHQSGWETLALQDFFPHQVFVCKKELFWIPILGFFLMMMSPIAINRKKPAEATKQILIQGLARKKAGFWISVFPEGTRIAPGEKGKYKLGAARMATQLQMNIVPVAVNSGEFWPKNSFLKYPGLITISIGPTIDYHIGSNEEIMQQCENWIEAEQKKIDGVGPFAKKHQPA